MIIIIKRTIPKPEDDKEATDTPHHRFLPFTIHTAAVQVESTSTSSVLNNTTTLKKKKKPHTHHHYYLIIFIIIKIYLSY